MIKAHGREYVCMMQGSEGTTCKPSKCKIWRCLSGTGPKLATRDKNVRKLTLVQSTGIVVLCKHIFRIGTRVWTCLFSCACICERTVTTPQYARQVFCRKSRPKQKLFILKLRFNDVGFCNFVILAGWIVPSRDDSDLNSVPIRYETLTMMHDLSV